MIRRLISVLVPLIAMLLAGRVVVLAAPHGRTHPTCPPRQHCAAGGSAAGSAAHGSATGSAASGSDAGSAASGSDAGSAAGGSAGSAPGGSAAEGSATGSAAGGSAAGSAAGGSAAGGSDSPQGSSDCPYEGVSSKKLDNAYDALKEANSSLPSSPITETRLETNGPASRLYLVIGPDGYQRGITPSDVREDTQLYTIVYEPIASPMEVTISGCDRLQTRVLGEAVPYRAAEGYRATIYTLGTCNADKQVSIAVKTKSCGERTVTLQTSPVYNLMVGYGAVYTSGSRTNVGVDAGTGGMPSTAFERQSQRGLEDRILLGWFPLGYSPDEPVFDSGWSLLRKIFLGTTIDPSAALSNVDVALGIEPAQGLALFIGVQYCEKEKALGGGLRSGAVFTDDSSRLPTTDSWSCPDGHWYYGGAADAFVGVSVTADLLGKLFSKSK